MTGCKETVCTTCAHLSVCKFRDEFLNAQAAVDNMLVGLGAGRTKRLRDFDYIKPVELQCKFHSKSFQGGAIR